MHSRLAAFGYDPESPLPAVGLVVGFAGFVIDWTTRPKSAPLDMESMTALSDEDFEQQMKDYEAGRGKTLPGQ